MRTCRSRVVAREVSDVDGLKDLAMVGAGGEGEQADGRMVVPSFQERAPVPGFSSGYTECKALGTNRKWKR